MISVPGRDSHGDNLSEARRLETPARKVASLRMPNSVSFAASGSRPSWDVDEHVRVNLCE